MRNGSITRAMLIRFHVSWARQRALPWAIKETQHLRIWPATKARPLLYQTTKTRGVAKHMPAACWASCWYNGCHQLQYVLLPHAAVLMDDGHSGQQLATVCIFALGACMRHARTPPTALTDMLVIASMCALLSSCPWHAIPHTFTI